MKITLELDLVEITIIEDALDMWYDNIGTTFHVNGIVEEKKRVNDLSLKFLAATVIKGAHNV